MVDQTYSRWRWRFGPAHEGANGYAAEMELETTVVADQDDGDRDGDEVIEAELLVEEISIDGMCGVY